MIWKALLLVYVELRVTLPIASRGRRRFHHRLSPQGIADAIDSFLGFPGLVCNLTNGAAEIDCAIKQIARPLNSVTEREKGEFWPSPDDTRPELDRLAPVGQYHSIFVFWPQHDLDNQQSVPGSAWGLGMGASDCTNDATYAAVANAPAPDWRNEARGEVWLHEWLHGVCHHFAERGYPMPERDADGGQLHGYQRSATSGWTDYYRDLMRGVVVEGDNRLGIPRHAWNKSPADSRFTPR
jgi:hypothetical protein